MGEGSPRERARTRPFPGTVAPGVRAKPPLGAPAQPPPSPLDRNALAAWAQSRRSAYRLAAEDNIFLKTSTLLQWLNARAGQLFALRVLNLYIRRRGPLLAAGNAYLMFFSVGAMLVAGFAIFGLIATGNELLRDAVIEVVARGTPGLIDTGYGGLATPEQLLGSEKFGRTLLISLAALVLTSLGWINGLREGIRSVMGLAKDRTNPVLSKVRDAFTLLVLAVALVLTSALGILSSATLGNISEFLGWDSFLTGLSARLGSLLLMLVLDVAVVMVMFSMASRVRMPRRVLLLASVFSGAGATFLRFLSAMFLGGVTNNALLAPFAVILGLFVWFYLLSQVYIIAAAIAAVRSADLRRRPGVVTSPAGQLAT